MGAEQRLDREGVGRLKRKGGSGGGGERGHPERALVERGAACGGRGSLDLLFAA